MARIKTMVAAGIAIVAVAACSSSKTQGPARSAPPPTTQLTTAAAATSGPGTPTQTSSAASSRPTRPTSSTSVATDGLSGTWAGQYSGSFSGTFTLTWTLAGSDLSGTITLSTPSDTVPIHGTVSNGKINFGTVGSTVITYSGSLSGSAMSGQYQVAGGAGGSGTWNAAKK